MFTKLSTGSSMLGQTRRAAPKRLRYLFGIICGGSAKYCGVLALALVVAFPFSASAATVYEYTPADLTDQGGGSAGDNSNFIYIDGSELTGVSTVDTVRIYIGGSEGSSPLDFRIRLCEVNKYDNCASGGSYAHNISSWSTETHTNSGTPDFYVFTIPDNWSYTDGWEGMLIQVQRTDSSGGVRTYGDNSSTPFTTPTSFASPSVNTYVALGSDGLTPGEPSCLDGDVGTCINEVQPYDGEVVATSTPTTIGADGYIAESDFVEGAQVRIKLDRQTDQQAVGAIIAWESAFGNYTEFDIDAFGEFDVSTSTIDTLLGANREGEWWMYTEIRIPKKILGITYGHTVLESYRSQFVYGELTGVDIIQNAGESVLEGIITNADPFENCQFDFSSVIDFSAPDNLLTCILGVASSVIVPNREQLSALLDQQYNDFITKPPFAYGFLTYEAITGYDNATTSNIAASNLAITFPDTGAFASSSAGSVAGATITFIDWSALATSMNGLDDNPALEGLYNFINLMMTVAFLYWLWAFARRIIP